MTTSQKCCIVHHSRGKVNTIIGHEWNKEICGIFLKLLLVITSCLSLSDPHISVFARLLSVFYYHAPPGSFIHMHALLKVIRYDTPESPVLQCVCQQLYV